MSDLLANLWMGFHVASNPYNVLFCLLGALVGTLVGVLPGIGTVATIAMLLPITFGLPPVGALIMLAGIYSTATKWRSRAAPGPPSPLPPSARSFRVAWR